MISVRWLAMVTGLFAIALATALPRAFAEDVPQSFTLDGRLFSDPQGTIPLEDALIGFKVQILDEAETCVLYEEEQNVNTATSKGYFSVRVGSAVGSTRRTTDDSANKMATVFQNVATVNGKLLSNGNACAVPAAAGKKRFVRISISPTSMGGAARILSPNLTIDSVPNAIVAERAESVQGFRGADLLKVNTTAGAALSQANLESFFSSVGRFNSLTAVVDGTSSNYVQTSANGARLPVIAGAPATPAQGSIWFDTGDNRLKFYDGSAPVTLSTGAGLTGTGTTNVIPRFTSATAIGDSALTDNGTLVSSTRSISVATGQNFRINGSRVLGIHDTNSLAVGTGANNSSAAGQNTAVGFNAHNSNATGNDNTAVGYTAASAILSGSHRNTAVGSSALANNTTGGSDNVAVGYYAGPRDGTGAISSSVYLGSEAGRNTNTGSLNTFLGTRAGTTTLGTTLLNSTAIGYNASVDANNSLVLGSSTVNVGIAGVTAPTSRLDFEGAVTIRGIAAPGLSAAGQGRIYFSSADNKFKVSQNGGAYADLVGAGGGVTEVTGTLPISVATGTTTPVVSIATANTTTAGALTAADWNTFNDKLTSPLTTKGDLLSRDGTTHVRLPVGANGQVLVPDSAETSGLKWTNFSIENLKTAGGATQFASAACTAAQTLTWSSLTNTFTCSNIAGLGAGVITTGTIDNARLPASATYWTSSDPGTINYSGGNVGIGVTTPLYSLHIEKHQAAGSAAILANTTVSASAQASFIPASDAGYVMFGMNSTARDSGSAYVWNNANTALKFATNNTEKMRITNTGNIGIGTPTPTAKLHLLAGTAAAETAPFKFTSGTNLTAPEAGAVEFDGSSLFYTTSTPTRVAVATVSNQSVADANYTVVASNRTVVYTSLTAARTATLPAASTVPAGTHIIVIDGSGSVTSTNTITVAPNGADTLNGVNSSVVLSTAWAQIDLVSNGTNGWFHKQVLNTQIFTANGTWTKPPGATMVSIILIGGGGGGASGKRGPSGTAAGGGCGGGGGGSTFWTGPVTGLPSTVAITVAGSAAGGTAQTVNSTNGIAGTNGGNSSFGSILIASGGTGGGAGVGPGSCGGGSGGSGYPPLNNSSLGGSAIAGVAGSNAAAATIYLTGGGGGGGGITTAPVALNGGNGNMGATMAGVGSGTAGVVGGAAPGNGASLTGSPYGSGGGGGGAANAAGPGQSGGSGGNYGGGGGGGGASLNGSDSGAGGNGGAGIAVIVTW